MAAKSLQRHLLRFFTATMVVVCLAIIVSVWVSSERDIRDQISSDIDVGYSVLERLLHSRKQQLLSSAEVLTSDFGFKQAVATNDVDTISSILVNHGNRIAADLVALLSVNGNIVTSPSSALRSGDTFPEPELVSTVMREGGAVYSLVLQGDIYQVLLMPVRAPIPVGVAVIGFRINKALADELKDITQLEVTFTPHRAMGNPFYVSTLPDAATSEILQAVDNIGPPLGGWFNRGHYITRRFDLAALDDPVVYLSSSVDDAYARFDSLQIKIVLITLLGISLALLYAVVFSRNLTRPLRSLAGLAASIANGHYRQQVSISADVNEVNELAGALNRMQRDLREREARIVFQANHDPLTHLINRRYAVERVDDLLAGSSAPYTVCVINVLGFRAMNDTFGHNIGDIILIEVAARLESLSNRMLTARLVGNEFLLVVKNTPELENVLIDTLALLSEPYTLSDLEISLKFCLGAAHYPDDGLTGKLLIQRASIALDTARRERFSIVHYNFEQEETYLKRLRLLTDLKLTLAKNGGQLCMYYQPKVAARDYSATHFEALVRWQHPIDGFVPPDVFVPLAEQSGLIHDLTDWVILTVITQLQKWRAEGFNAKVAINLSAQDLQRSELLQQVNSLLRTLNVPMDALAFEVTESEVMRDPEKSMALLDMFRSQGFNLAIDDFGTGHSSLAQLKNMPVTELKIDRMFVMNLTTLAADRIIVRSILDLARSFNLAVVAEGVEDEETAALLSGWGVDWLQGYYFSRSLPADQVIKWCEKFEEQHRSV